MTPFEAMLLMLKGGFLPSDDKISISIFSLYDTQIQEPYSPFKVCTCNKKTYLLSFR